MKKITMQMVSLAVFTGAILCAAPLVADTLGFWDFKDGAPGEAVSKVNSSVGTTVFTGTAGKSSVNGALPTFSSDSPGRIIVSCRDETELCAAPQSVAFRYPDRTNRQSGLIDIGGIVDELVGKGSFTIELFAKMDENYQYWMEGDGQWDQKSKTALYFQAEENVGGFKMLAPRDVITDGDAAGHAKGFGIETYKRGEIESKSGNSGTDISDGKWHHLAAVYAETNTILQTGTLRFYVDYKKMVEMPYANTTQEAAGLTLRLGTGYKVQPPSPQDIAAGKDYADKTSTEPINASLACLRVSSGALAAEDFEVVHEVGKTVFAIGFNEESATEGSQIGTELYKPLDLAVYSEIGLSPTASFVYGLHPVAFPTYDKANSRINRDVRWVGRKMWKNLAGCHFIGRTSLSSDTSPSREWAGTELCLAGSDNPAFNPPSWTMEAFVRVEYPTWGREAVGSLLFGKYTANGHKNGHFPQYCWMLTRTRADKGSKLRLAWTEVKDGEYASTDTDYFKSAETDVDYLGDGRWHHVALSYNQTMRTFTLYVDYQSVLTATVSERGLLDLPYGYYFSRLQCTSGFEGWMDEIRFTTGALKPETFETLDKAGLTISIR